MSQENVESSKRGYKMLNDALKSGDMGVLTRRVEERFDPEVVFKPAGAFPESEEVHGHDGALRFLATQMEAFEAMWFEPQGFIDAGDRVVVPVRVGGRARHTGIDLEFERVHVWSYRSGKVVRLEMYASKREAFEAAGLRE
jgi:ketosteroid isomerase-like protein